jgi:hypothetical protein
VDLCYLAAVVYNLLRKPQAEAPLDE